MSSAKLTHRFPKKKKMVKSDSKSHCNICAIWSSRNVVTTFILGSLLLVGQSSSFVVRPSDQSKSILKTLVFGEDSNVLLWMGRKSRGGLSDIDLSSSPAESNKKYQKKNSKASVGGKKAVSSKLAEWAATQESTTTSTPSSTLAASKTDDEDDDISSTFTRFSDSKKKGKKKGSTSSSDRRIKQSQRMAEDAVKNEKVMSIINDIKSSLEQTKNDISDVLGAIRQLQSIQEENIKTNNNFSLRQVVGNAEAFRLTWVGSDDAITHIGTGLQKVPLARMEEVFIRFLMSGKRIEVLEVIRILGPFPNVRNTLLGDIEMNKKSQQSMNFCYDSMVDGTGKEILAGEESNKKLVKLHVLYADQNAIVLVVPPVDDNITLDDDYIYGNNGKNILLFTKTDDLQSELARLRVD